MQYPGKKREKEIRKPYGGDRGGLLLKDISKLGNMVKEEKNMESTASDENGVSEEINDEGPSLATAAVSMETSSRDDSSLSEKEQEDQLKSTKAEMGEVREENERLKMVLGQIVKDYQSLQKHFLDIVKQEESKKSRDDIDSTHQKDEEENELVSLSLGTHAARHPKKHEKRTIFNLTSEGKQDEKFNEGPKLGLDCKFEPSLIVSTMNPSPKNSVEEQKEEEPSTTETGNRTLKTMRSGGEDELLQQNQLKRARVSVRARCDTPTMNDGCQWRKYGQKIAKGNPCPRAYYRCTVSPSCPVRKQVQRCAEDMSILITTYEGTHNHPLPMSATAMASTTSAAASMLQSGSSTSQPGYHGASVTTTNATSNTANLHGLNFTSSSSHNSKVPPQQFYFPNSSISTLNSHPTITLDLTAPTTTSHHNFNRLFSSAPRYPSTCLNFSSSTSTSSNCLESNSSSSGIQTPWGSTGYQLRYGTPPSSYNRSNQQVGYSLSLGRQPSHQEQLYQAHYMQTNNNQQNHSQSTLIENTVAAATKAAITSDPTFRSALEAAIASLVNNNGGGGLGGDDIKSNHNMKWGY